MPGVSMRLILLLVPLRIGEAGGERVLAGDFFFVEVGDRRAFVDFAEAVDHAGVDEDGRGELRFAGAAVTDERDIADAGGVVDLHRRAPPSGRLNDRASYSRRRSQGGRPHRIRPDAERALFVAQRFDRVEARRLEGGIHAEEDADRRREAEADGERPPRQRDREARDQVDAPADGAAERRCRARRRAR